MTADAPTWHPVPMRTLAPMNGVRSDDGVGPEHGVRMHPRGRVHPCRPTVDPDQQPGLGNGVLAHRRHAPHEREARAAALQHHLQPQPVARHHLPPELGVVHTPQHGAGAARIAVAMQQQQDATCSSASIIITPGINGMPGKWP